MIKHAIKLSQRSTLERAQIGAVLVKSGRVLAKGYNKINRYQGTIKSGHWKTSLHAEMACLLNLMKLGNIEDAQGATMFVARHRRNGSTGLAYPCKDCFEIIRSFGIKKVVFTIDEGVSEIRI